MRCLNQLIQKLDRRASVLAQAGFVTEVNQLDQARIRAEQLRADLERLAAAGEKFK